VSRTVFWMPHFSSLVFFRSSAARFLFVGIVGNAGFSKGFLFPSSFECFPLSTEEEEEEEETKAKEISFRETKV